MAANRQVIWELLEPTVVSVGFELADLEVDFGHGRGLIRLFIDSESGVTVDDCERVSRQVSSALDVAELVGGQYCLEVSSPGLDRRLVKPAHFDRFAGAQVRVKLRRLVDGRRQIRGTLVARHGNMIEVSSDGGAQRIALADVEMVRLVPEFHGAAGN